MLLSRLRSRASNDRGFTIVELTVAGGVIAAALTLLAGVVTSSLTATGYARERQSANQLANRALEQARALPYETIQAGLQGGAVTDDLALHPDSNIAATGCGTSYCFGGERVVLHTGGSNVDPLVPHRTNAVVGPTTFTISTYVTNYNNDPTSCALRVTVYVTWPSALRNTTASVQAQTIVLAKPPTSSSVSACTVSPIHQLPGPSLPSFTTTAQQAASSALVSGTIGGAGLDHATLLSGRSSSDASIEQVSQVQGTTQASGATLKVTGGQEQSLGRSALSSRADSDPSVGTPPVYDTKTLPTQAAGNVNASLGSDTLTLSTTGGDTGSTTSTISACTAACTNPSTPTPRLCPNITGISNETDQLHCGGATETTASTLNAQANMGPLGNVTLAVLGPQVNPTTATVDRKTAVGGTTCITMPAPPTDGCVRSALTRNGTDLSAGALPSNLNAILKPLNFTYFAQITGLTDSVAAEAGPGSGAPTAVQSTGSVKVYCASAILGDLLCPVTGYVTKSLNTITSALTTPTLSITDLTFAGGTTITMSATITPGSTSATSTGTPRTSATATSKPVSVSVAYKIVSAGVTVLDTNINLDPGALTATTTYAPPVQ